MAVLIKEVMIARVLQTESFVILISDITGRLPAESHLLTDCHELTALPLSSHN